MTDKTNVPAFPTPVHNLNNDGMTLRDYFAAKAMQGMLAESSDYTSASLSVAAYECADAMLKAREAK